MTLSEVVGDAVVGIGTAATVIAAFYAALSYHRPKTQPTAADSGRHNPYRAVGLMVVMVAFAWGAVAFEYLSRPDPISAQITSYGFLGNNQFQAHLYT